MGRPPSRKAVLNRVLAGLGGGYILAATAAFCLAAILPGARIEAVLTAEIVAYLLFVIIALWSFVPRRGATAWVVIAGLSALFLLLGLAGEAP